METKVVNKYKHDYDIYIGRGSIFGNPWSHNEAAIHDIVLVSTREEAIENYRKWLTGQDHTKFKQHERFRILRAIPYLRGKRLGCFCKPLSCHGDVLIEILNKENKTA